MNDNNNSLTDAQRFQHYPLTNLEKFQRDIDERMTEIEDMDFDSQCKHCTEYFGLKILFMQVTAWIIN